MSLEFRTKSDPLGDMPIPTVSFPRKRQRPGVVANRWTRRARPYDNGPSIGGMGDPCGRVGW
jgi:hypothetical protein